MFDDCTSKPTEEEQKEAKDKVLKSAEVSVAWRQHDCLPEQTAELLFGPGWKGGLWGGAMFLQLASSAPQQWPPPSPVPAVPLWICPWWCHPSPKGGPDGGLAFGQHTLQEPQPLGGSKSQGGELWPVALWVWLRPELAGALSGKLCYYQSASADVSMRTIGCWLDMACLWVM